MTERNDTADVGHEPAVSIPVINNGDRFAQQKFKLCYFESGRLLSADIFPMAFQYLAISHVWGQPKWQHIPGIQGQVLASDSKAKFIAQRLPGLVGADYFWMDILCVDQKDKGARVAVTQYIPRIFRHAQRTIFVKDDVGIQMCCAGAMDFSSTVGEGDLGELLTIHRDRFHRGQYINERMLTRLWILEETILSNTIQFANGRCIEDSDNNSDISVQETAVHLSSTRFVWKLRELAKAWAGAFHPWESTPKSAIDQDSLSFIHGYFNNGTIQCSGVNIRPLHPFPEVHTFYAHISSTRRTSKPRDFILATMPQYSFYQVPSNARDMSYRELFKDCVYQLWKSGFPMQPLVPRNVALKLSELATPEHQFTFQEDENASFPQDREETLCRFPLPEIGHDGGPEPACLGDLVKLFCGPRILWDFYPPLDAENVDLDRYQTFPVEGISESNPFSAILPADITWIKVDYPENWRVLRPLCRTRISIPRARKVDSVMEIKIDSESELLSLLKETVSSSRIMWPAAILGELHEIAQPMSTIQEGVPAEIHFASKFLHIWWLSQHSDPPSPEIADSKLPDDNTFIDNAVRLAALITCGLGSSTFEWSKQNLTPALVSIAGKRIMSLIPTFLYHRKSEYEYWLVGAVMPGDRWALLALDRRDKALVTPCIFPWDVDLDPL